MLGKPDRAAMPPGGDSRRVKYCHHDDIVSDQRGIIVTAAGSIERSGRYMATRHSSLSIGWLATVISVLSACTPSDSVPLSGSVSLEYVGTSHSDGAVDFALANGSSRSIYFRGNPEPRGATMSCIRPEEAAGFMQAIADPPATEETVKVSPGIRLRTSLFVIRLPDRKSVV